MLANGARGEVALQIDGKTRFLCLTLGAMARLETAFGVGDITELRARLARPAARDFLVLLEALLVREPGEVCQAKDLASAQIDWPQAIQAIVQTFERAAQP